MSESGGRGGIEKDHETRGGDEKVGTMAEVIIKCSK